MNSIDAFLQDGIYDGLDTRCRHGLWHALGDQVPTSENMRRLTVSDLRSTPNCGPQTIKAIKKWAALRGIEIPDPRPSGWVRKAKIRKRFLRELEATPSDAVGAMDRALHAKEVQRQYVVKPQWNGLK